MADAVETKPVPIYDISGPQPVLGNIHPDEVQSAVQSGQFSLPQNAKVSVVNPEGELGTIQAHEAPEAFANGYEYATPKHINDINFGTGAEQIKAGIEGLAEGVAGPLATAFETQTLGVKPENIRARAEANPITSNVAKIAGLGAGLMTGTGEAALLEGAGQAVVRGIGLEGNIARGAARAATEMALLSSGDEMSKLILNDPNQSIESAITNIGLSGLLGGVGGAALGSIEPLAKAASDTKLGKYVGEIKEALFKTVVDAEKIMVPELATVEAAGKAFYDPFLKQGAKAPEVSLVSTERAGIDPFTKMPLEAKTPVQAIAEMPAELPKPTEGEKTIQGLITRGLEKLTGHGLGAAIGAKVGGMLGSHTLGAIVGERALGPFLDSVMPTLIKPLIEKGVNSSAFKAAAEYGVAVVKGQTLMNKAVASVLKPSGEVLPKSLLPTVASREKLDKKLTEIAANPEKILDVGGQSSYYLPNHSMQMGETAARVVGYLNSQRPHEEKMAPLDQKPVVNQVQKAEYEKALDLAEQPLTILQDIKDGTIRPQDVSAIKAMYPSLYNKLSMNMNHEILEHVSSGNEIPYKTRLGMSLFLGHPLDSTMTQQGIMSAQMTMMKPATQPQQMMPKSKMSATQMKSAISEFQTPQQARIKSRSTAQG